MRAGGRCLAPMLVLPRPVPASIRYPLPYDHKPDHSLEQIGIVALAVPKPDKSSYYLGCRAASAYISHGEFNLSIELMLLS